MLRQLTITNFAIIDRLELALEPGLNVLTGETGAGKSIVIDAVGSLLGSRLGPEFIRTGADQAHVEGIFDTPTEGLLPPLLAEQDLGDDDDSAQLIVARALNKSGRSVARVNGRAVPLAQLQQVGHHLIDIHGQSEHLSLLRVQLHIDFLDGYAGLRSARANFGAQVAVIRQVRRELDELLRDERELARRMDLLRFQTDEIGAAELRSGEEDELKRERHLLANAERLSAAADSAYKLLYASEDDSPSATDLLGQAAIQLAELARLDPATEPLAKNVEEVSYQIEDVVRSLGSYRDEIEYNPARLEAVEERLNVIKSLKRKYGGSVDEVLRFGERAAAELEAIGNRDERVAELRQRESKLLAELGLVAEALSGQRQIAAASLAREVERELADLNMARSRFQVAIRRQPAPDGLPGADGQSYAFEATGIDRVEFMISTNPGEPEKPLARIVSGGETSRLMLALKTILARADFVPVLIFDEIDVGIGGRSGYVVGQKLAGLARERQVICVTHLPQIACFADAHFSIAKQIEGERTATRIARLNEEERVAELAVMLGGDSDSVSAQANARDLLGRARAWRAEDGPASPAESGAPGSGNPS